MAQDNKVVTEDEIKKVEREVLAEQAAADSRRREEIERLTKDAEARGAASAKARWEEEQRLSKIEEENRTLKAELKKQAETSEERLRRLAAELEEKILAADNRKKGLSKNDSPFAKNTPSVTDSYRDPEVQKQVEDESRRRWAEKYGIGSLRY